MEGLGKQEVNMSFSFPALRAGKREPPPKCRVGRSLIQKYKWAPCDLFRLFCACRTCSPKPGTAPFIFGVGSKHNFQSRAWQGYFPFPITSYFVHLGYRRDQKFNVATAAEKSKRILLFVFKLLWHMLCQPGFQRIQQICCAFVNNV